MNYLLLSPHFPPNYRLFSARLRERGVNVLGMADEPYDRLHPELREALAEYYRVPDLHDYDALLRGVGHLIHRHGRVDGLDSHNEYWLETEARLRTDFNVPGLRAQDLPAIKQKSRMKAMFEKAGVAAPRGCLVREPADARAFAAEVGFPLIAKPDIGVGAHRTWKLESDADLGRFLRERPDTDYFLEDYVRGDILTFDGLTDPNGEVVFCSSMQYSQGIMETVNDDRDVYYYTFRDIPADLESAGRAVAAAYGLRGRLFHFEFFRTPEGALLALEVNMRPPGGLTTDMFNYANDMDIYAEWANIVTGRPFSARIVRPYHCAYVGRKAGRDYVRDHAAVVAGLGARLVHHEPIAGVFRAALGDYGYLVRSPQLDDIHDMANWIQARRGKA